MSDTLHFGCDFGNGVSVALTFNKARYLKAGAEGKPRVMQWTGQPTAQMRPAIIAWLHSVNAEIAKAVGEKILDAIKLGSAPAEFWIYHPDGKRERVHE